MIYTIKKLFNIALQNITRLRIILRGFSNKTIESIHSRVSTVTNATGVRIGNKRWLKNRVQYVENSVMQHSVSDNGFMNMATLRVVDKERGMCSMLIALIHQITMEFKDVFLKLPLKLAHIPLLLFVAPKLIPGRKQVF